jgi:hypothetical protein
VLSQDERDTVEAISVAAYAGSNTRKPEDDVRWLLWLVGELAPSPATSPVAPGTAPLANGEDRS